MHRFRTIIYDFDGVILDTAGLKIDGFCAVYEGEEASKVDAVRAYAEAHGGLSRYQKFTHFEEAIFRRDATPERIRTLCCRYGEVIDPGVAAAPFIAGVPACFSVFGEAVRQHVVSAAPEEDLRRSLLERNLSRFFTSIAGAPKQKLAEFRRILREDAVEAGEALAIGDSLTEYEAACALGIPFLAVVAPQVVDRFPAGVTRVPDLEGLLKALSRVT